MPQSIYDNNAVINSNQMQSQNTSVLQNPTITNQHHLFFKYGNDVK